MQKARGTRVQGGLHRQGPARTVLSPPNCTLVVFSKYLKPYIRGSRAVYFAPTSDEVLSFLYFLQTTRHASIEIRVHRAHLLRKHASIERYSRSSSARTFLRKHVRRGLHGARTWDKDLQPFVGEAAGRDTIALCTLYELTITQTVSVYTMQRLFMFPQKCTLSISARARTAQCLPAAAR